jgi:hypothetical protein
VRLEQSADFQLIEQLISRGMPSEILVAPYQQLQKTGLYATNNQRFTFWRSQATLNQRCKREYGRSLKFSGVDGRNEPSSLLED